jgi:hypothetical protein
MMVLDVKDELVYAKLESFKNTLIDFWNRDNMKLNNYVYDTP